MYDPATLLPMFANGLPLACLPGANCCDEVEPPTLCAQRACLDLPIPSFVTVTMASIACPPATNGTFNCTLANDRNPTADYLHGCHYWSDIAPAGVQYLDPFLGWRPLYFGVRAALRSEPTFATGTLYRVESYLDLYKFTSPIYQRIGFHTWFKIYSAPYACNATHALVPGSTSSAQTTDCGLTRHAGSTSTVVV